MVVPNVFVVRPSEPRMTSTPNYVGELCDRMSLISPIRAHPQSWVGVVVVMEIALVLGIARFLWASVVW